MVFSFKLNATFNRTYQLAVLVDRSLSSSPINFNFGSPPAQFGKPTASTIPHLSFYYSIRCTPVKIIILTLLKWNAFCATCCLEVLNLIHRSTDHDPSIPALSIAPIFAKERGSFHSLFDNRQPRFPTGIEHLIESLFSKNESCPAYGNVCRYSESPCSALFTSMQSKPTSPPVKIHLGEVKDHLFFLMNYIGKANVIQNHGSFGHRVSKRIENEMRKGHGTVTDH